MKSLYILLFSLLLCLSFAYADNETGHNGYLWYDNGTIGADWTNSNWIQDTCSGTPCFKSTIAGNNDLYLNTKIAYDDTKTYTCSYNINQVTTINSDTTMEVCTNAGIGANANCYRWQLDDTNDVIRMQAFSGGWTEPAYVLAINTWYGVNNTWTGTTMNNSMSGTHTGDETHADQDLTTLAFTGFRAYQANVNIKNFRCWEGTPVDEPLTPPTPAAATNFSITATDAYNGTALQSFNATVNGTEYTTTTGQINTTIPSNSTALFNITMEAIGYYTRTYLNYNVSANLAAELNKTHRLYNITYSNHVLYLGNNYVRNLSYFVNYTCPSFSTTALELYVNGSYIRNHNLTCDNSTNSLNTWYQYTTEGNYSIKLHMNTSFLPAINNINSSVSYFVWDLNDPIAIGNFTAVTGFNNHSTNVTMTCTDTVTPLLLYNLSFNSVVLNYGNQSNNTQIWNSSTIVDGNNTITAICSDFFSSDTYTNTVIVYAKTLALIDEKENTAFDVYNISGARVYFDDNSSFYDFQVGNSSTINFTSIDIEKLRFELVYADGSIVTRYIDSTLIEDEELRVCANKEGITHYEQLILSATEKRALLKNVFSNCYVAADYTRFAYQDAYILKAFTIASLYYLHANINGVTTYLASVDGSIPTYINLDTLEFQQTAYNLNILRDALSISETSDPDIIEIYYRNIADDNTKVDITITRMDTSTTVFTLTETATPNEWTLLFDKSTLTNVTNQTLFRIQLDKTTATGTSTIKRYFNFNGSSGVLSSGFAFVIAVLITVFGLTFTVARLTFSYFGIITQLIAIAFISFATMTWYLLFLLGLDIIILVFIVVLMFKENYPTVS